MKKFGLILLSLTAITCSGCAPLVPMVCKSNGLEFKKERVVVGLSSDELVKRVGNPAKIKKSSEQEKWIYYTGNFRHIFIGIVIFGREQYHFIFENDKLKDIIFFSSANGAWSEEAFCNAYAK